MLSGAGVLVTGSVVTAGEARVLLARDMSAPAPEPTPEQREERARRADRATKGALAAMLALEAVVALLVPRAIAFTDGGLGTGRTIALVALAVLLIAAAGTIRRGIGIALGSVLQVALVLTGVWTTAMLVARRDLRGASGCGCCCCAANWSERPAGSACSSPDDACSDLARALAGSLTARPDERLGNVPQSICPV